MKSDLVMTVKEPITNGV